jgi:hypothetical protein
VSLAEQLAAAALGVGRRAFGLLGPATRKAIEDRIFRAVFHGTRITNDAYGWRPPPREPPGERR